MSQHRQAAHNPHPSASTSSTSHQDGRDFFTPLEDLVDDQGEIAITIEVKEDGAPFIPSYQVLADTYTPSNLSYAYLCASDLSSSSSVLHSYLNQFVTTADCNTTNNTPYLPPADPSLKPNQCAGRPQTCTRRVPRSPCNQLRFPCPCHPSRRHLVDCRRLSPLPM